MAVKLVNAPGSPVVGELERMIETIVRRVVAETAVPEMIRDGAELASVLHVSRWCAWAITKRPDFAAACPASRLSSNMVLRRRQDVIAWLEAQVSEGPEFKPRTRRRVHSFGELAPSEQLGTTKRHRHDYRPPSRRASVKA